MRIFALSIFLIHSAIFAQELSRCNEVSNWIYKDLTISSLKEAYDIIKKKVMISVLVSQQNTKNIKLSKHKHLIIQYKSLLKNGGEFVSLANKYKPLKRYRFWRPRSYKKAATVDFEEAIYAWKLLQEWSPEYFKGLEEQYLLNDWDMYIVKSLRKIEGFSISDASLKEQLLDIANKMQTDKEYKLSESDLNKLRDSTQSDQSNLIVKNQEKFKSILNELKDLCTEDELQNLLAQCQSLSENSSPSVGGIASLSLILQAGGFKDATKPKLPEPVIEKPKYDDIDLLYINQVSYKTNPDRDAYYCKRDINALSGITIHHTATTPNKDSLEQINKYHLTKSTDDNKWFMVGYHYLISNNDSSSPLINTGRPLEYAGSHSVGRERKLTDKEFNRIKDMQITCAHDERGHKRQTPGKLGNQFKQSRKPKTNLTTVGIALIEDYVGRVVVNVGGVITIKKRGRRSIKRASQQSLLKVAQLACKLQRQNKNIQTIRPHSYYKTVTTCPGSVTADLQKIADMASNYGCQFKVEYRK